MTVTARSVGRAFGYPALTVWRNRRLIRTMVRRDILGRYRGSFGGSFWTIINPLLLMATYFFVFGVVLNRGEQSRTDFALYFLAGMLPWLAFSEAVGRSPSVMLEHRNFVKKLVFAVETLPVNLVVSGLVSEAFAVVLYCIFLVAIRHALPPTILWLPVLIVPQVLLTAGICWFLAALGVFVRDLGQIISYILTVWFFITPICYPEDALTSACARGWRKIRSRSWCADIARCFSMTSRRNSGRYGSCGCWASLSRCWATRGSTSCGSRSRT